MLDTIRIRQKFSRAARNYDLNSSLQKRIALQLLANIKVSGITANNVLDIGIGTGWFAEKVSQLFKCDIFGIDSAIGMTSSSKERKGIKASVVEAENLAFKDNSFDLVVSNLAYQWVEDLGGAFSEVARVLQPGAPFYFTCFGKNTLSELRNSFNHAFAGRRYLSSYALPGQKLLSSKLKTNGFKIAHLNRKIFYEYFIDLYSLLRWLKIIGANTLTRPGFINRGIFVKADDFYRKNFKYNGGIFATFEIIRMVAINSCRQL